MILGTEVRNFLCLSFSAHLQSAAAPVSLDASPTYNGKTGQSVTDLETVNVYYRVLHAACWVKDSRLRNLSNSMRKTGLLPVSSVEQ